jgi:hypothetical protein
MIPDESDVVVHFVKGDDPQSLLFFLRPLLN